MGSGDKVQGLRQAGELPGAKIPPFSPVCVRIYSKFLDSIGISLKHAAGMERTGSWAHRMFVPESICAVLTNGTACCKGLSYQP